MPRISSRIFTLRERLLRIRWSLVDTVHTGGSIVVMSEHRYWNFRYNSGDVEAVMALMAEGVAYHDLALYQEPFRGKDAVRAYFEKVTATVPGDLKFKLEHITSGDPNAVGVRW